MRYTGTLVVIALIIGTVIGWGINNIADMRLAGTDQPSRTEVGVGGGPEITTTPTASQNSTIRLSVNNLLHEHGQLVILHLEALNDGKDTIATAQQLENNSQKIADFIGSLYGQEVRSEFLFMWQEHIQGYMAYTRALNDNDQEGMEKARNELTIMADEMGKYMNTVDSSIQATEFARLMKEHVNGTLSIIDAHAQDDQARKVTQIKAAGEQATRFAEFLSARIIQQTITPKPTAK